jgi:hypothetical protein
VPDADLAILGASIRTLDPRRPHARAVAARDGITEVPLLIAVVDDTRRPPRLSARGSSCQAPCR